MCHSSCQFRMCHRVTTRVGIVHNTHTHTRTTVDTHASYNRRNIIVAGCVIWNLATMGLGMSASFWELLLFRLLLGFGEYNTCTTAYI